MYHILYIIFSWVVFIVLFSALVLMFFWMWSNITAKVPFMSVPNKTLKDIEKALNLKDDSIVYDLGCGDGRVLFSLYKNNPKAKYVGIENNSFAFLLLKVKNIWHKKKYNSNITILKKDFFDIDLSEATHVFTYLYPNIMDDLLSKFDRELKKGTRLVSTSFHFTTKREVEVIYLKRGKWELAKEIYVYEF